MLFFVTGPLADDIKSKHFVTLLTDDYFEYDFL